MEPADVENRVPQGVLSTLDSLREKLQAALGPEMIALVLHGGLARGRYRPGRSDINIVVVLREGSRAALEAISPVLTWAWRLARVEPLILTRDEVNRAASAFPTKILQRMVTEPDIR